MRLLITSETKIYVAVAANAATGGPELLHQLVHNLRIMNLDAFMYYLPNDYEHPVHPAYIRYENPYVREIKDSDNNIIIVPEIYEMIKIFSHLKYIQKVIWWLSVDNFYVSRSLNIFPYMFLINGAKIINRFLGFPKYDIAKIALHLNRRFNASDNKLLKSAKVHFAQSTYAIETLNKIGISENQIFYLSDYLNEDFLKNQYDYTKKENIIIYNPAKGYQFTKRIIEGLPEYKFIPIRNMTRNEVLELFFRAKLYIDFGNHPGKDRMPREAAIAGCCVITGLRGSAGSELDLPILSKYKFDDTKKNLHAIQNCIIECLNEYPNRVSDFKNYIDKISSEKDKFISDLNAIFIRE